MNDYQVLGLNEGADQKEVKKAYFKLVRQFPPEKDPEKFQQIRRAYENILEGRATHLELAIPNDPLARQMAEQMQDDLNRKHYKEVIETGETAVRYFGEADGFVYLLATAQLRNGNSGKAVKNFEKLSKRNPENLEFMKQYAIACKERGFSKKAVSAFENVYGRGCRDIDFLYEYALNCRENKQNLRARDLLLELVRSGVGELKANVAILLNAYMDLFELTETLNDMEMEELVDLFCRFLGDIVPYMSGREDDISYSVTGILAVLKRCGNSGASAGRIQDQLLKGFSNKKAEELWDGIEQDAEMEAFDTETRLSEPFRLWAAMFFAKLLGEQEDQEEMRVILLDCKLCILEEWPQVQTEMEIIREDYPLFYGEISDYLETLKRTSNIDYLRKKMQKEYSRLERWYMMPSIHDRLYGKGGKASGTFMEDTDASPDFGYGASTETYVRPQPKIGRNDPCPCGSGKKYKNCCGRKAQAEI